MNSFALILADTPNNLLPNTTNFPLGLLKIAGLPILQRQIEAYLAAGLVQEHIVVVVGHEGEKVKAYLGKNFPQVQLVENANFSSPNRALALQLGLETLGLSAKSLNCGSDNLNSGSNALELSTNALKNTPASKNIDKLFVSMDKGLFSAEFFQEFVASPESSMAKHPKQDGKAYLYKLTREILPRLAAKIGELAKDKKQKVCIFETLSKEFLLSIFHGKNEKIAHVENYDALLFADKLFSTYDFKAKKAFFFDIDGTIFLGNTPIIGAVDFLKKYATRFDFYFLTNNTSKTPEQYLDKLGSIGLNIVEKQIVTPLDALFVYIEKKQYTSLYLIANERVKAYVQKNLPHVGLELDMQKNQAVVLAYDTELTYEKMKNLAILLNNKKDVEYIATHADFFCPHEQGPIPDVGGMIEFIKATNGCVPHTVLGKPSVHLLQKYMDKYGVENITMVGDRLYTDKKLADNAGCDFICVLSGETTRQDLVHDTTRYPAIVVKDLGEIDKEL